MAKKNQAYLEMSFVSVQWTLRFSLRNTTETLINIMAYSLLQCEKGHIIIIKL